MEQHNHAEKSS